MPDVCFMCIASTKSKKNRVSSCAYICVCVLKDHGGYRVSVSKYHPKTRLTCDSLAILVWNIAKPKNVI